MQPNIVTHLFLLFLSLPFFSSDLPSFLSFVLPLSVSFLGLTDFFVSLKILHQATPCLFLAWQIFQTFLQICSLVKNNVFPSQHFGSSKVGGGGARN